MSALDDLNLRIDRAAAALTALQEDDQKPLWFDRDYPINVKIPLTVRTPGNFDAFGTASGNTTVEEGYVFFVKGLEQHTLITGLLLEDDGASSLSTSLPETLRINFLDFTWMIRDNESDSDWGNVPLPSTLFRSGNVNSLDLLCSQRKLREGTRITVTLNPTFLTLAAFWINHLGFSSIQTVTVQVVVRGVHVRKGLVP